MSRFASLDRLANRALDRLMAEELRIEPMTGGEFSGAAADTSRTPFTVWGVVDLTPVIIGSRETSRGAQTSQLSGHAIEVSVQTALLSFTPKAGDRIVATTRGETYVVEVSQPDGVGRTVMRCTRGRHAGG